jgi:hypothetical protein
MLCGILYVAKLNLNELLSEPLKQGKRSNVLLDFKLETISQSPSQIGTLTEFPQLCNYERFGL